MFKEEVTQYCLMCQEWAEKYEKLKAENDELKKYGNHCLEPNSFKCKHAFIVNEKLKQTLKEIKNITFGYCEGCKKYEPEKYKNGECWHCFKNQILKKIKEVENGNKILQ